MNELEKESLRVLKRFKNIRTVSYESEYLPYTVEAWYLPDFVITTVDGRTIYLETKGWFRPRDRQKMLSVKRNNPHLDIRLVFMKDNKISKSSKTKYSDWCEKHGFIYSVGSIPAEWFR